ncbi:MULTISPECIES: right-handed parallel beta-helix repeat-containing protein [Methylosinus]|uniref:Right handed beta helix domain-containing protein n=1 Tax=Methylosinus trichosporium (strain ATCC 35070 / NCIMB 11131 / UNIQEM 75 / OB3b) TaxID=595536 RepID=A0A2D2D3N1_METT3|nr:MULTISPECIES: right-handed parallel beta-helix repeat-containing protein [Methylosinus]ATQ69584.1 hypothetical protein CQW49_18130 [Methylosinus trichosporium OB3b]OBS54335.1 hypothetical protein A8B73_01135 [Methylosinus sp. 3S-1]
MRSKIAFAGAALACLSAAPALAGSVSFVSATGDDTRNCATPATACRTFQRAHDATSPHGEIIALTPGDYGLLRITKSISVTGVEGVGIFGGAGSSDQIKIAAGASDVVYLTGLTLEGAGAGAGIVVDSAAAVTIRKCAVSNIASSRFYGIFMGGFDRTLIEDTSVSNGNDNIAMFGGRALVHRVISTNAKDVAIVSRGALTIAETSASGSSDGISRSAPIFMTRSAVTGNRFSGVLGDVTSAGDNLIRGNGTDVSGTVTNIGRQ